MTISNKLLDQLLGGVVPMPRATRILTMVLSRSPAAVAA